MDPDLSGSNLAMFGFKWVKLGLGDGRLDQGSSWKSGDGNGHFTANFW